MLLAWPRFWRLLAFCVVCLFVALGVTFGASAQETPLPGSKREFWVWDLRVMPPATRRATATLRANGARSLIYVEDSLWQQEGPLGQAYVNRLQWQLETATPAGAWSLEQGVIPLEERLFGPLPQRVGSDERLVVLFADLGQYKNQQFDGFFNVFDQLSDTDSQAKYQQRSNESNVIYLNGLRRSESYTNGVIAHELQHLLSFRPNGEREVWLSEMLAEGAMLLTGYFTDQPHVNAWAANSGKYPLVTDSYVAYGPQLVFASFLLDSLNSTGTTAIDAISRTEEPGKAAVERVFREQAGLPLNFDAIFSNFVSYVFGQAGQGPLPKAWAHEEGIRLPEIAPYYTFQEASGEVSGQLAPYSFLAIHLAQDLSPSVVIETERVGGKPGAHGCAEEASVLWKPISPRRIALYAVGCEPSSPKESVGFRFKILDRPALLPRSPLSLLPF